MADDAELDAARGVIAAQAAEIERLRVLVGGQELAEELRRIVTTIAAAGLLARPMAHSQLLVLIVRTAAHVIRARAGSALLLDADTQELVFEASATEDVSELRRVRIPLGQGIAGLVALTGQPMAVADAQSDPRHASEVARQTGLMPQSLLCVPLVFQDEVIGVLELLDKQGTAGFDAVDMEALGLFAQQAAVAIEQSRAQQELATFLHALLGAADQDGVKTIAERVAAFVQADASHRRSLELAALVCEITEHGDEETTACKAILTGFASYLRSRQTLSGGWSTSGGT